ncbi:MAG: hypothetical protein LQ349_001503 [Xanthoria aureola]|nr:MAG: hypothetical protein LQ349_001503 [Xanthoria aureola]
MDSLMQSTNFVYPSNGLAPTDKGGPSSSSAKGPTGGPGPTTTEAGQTTTSTSNNVDTTTAAPIPGQTIVSQTNSDGAPIVASVSSFLGSLYQTVLTVNKFAPTTLNQYTTLQSETTVTTTITRDGVPIMFPLVIGPGGVAWVPVGVPPRGIVPPGGDPGDDSDEGDDGNDEDSTTESQSSTTTTSSSSSASSTETTVTAIGDVNYPNWEAINQVPLNPNAPIPDGDDFATSTSTSSTSPPAPTPKTTTPPTPTSTLTLYPTGLDVNCLPAQPAGTRMLSCLGMLNRIPADQELCTSDPGACLSRGDSFCAASSSGGSCDPSITSPQETINTSNYCLLAQSSGCAFVIANKQPSFGGFPGSSCVTGAQMDQFIRGAANRCAGAGAGGDDGVVALQVGPDVMSGGVRSDTYCLVGEGEPGVCGA